MKFLKGLSSVKGTKRALIASAACTLLCGLLLFSTSIAWFTANKESSVNELYSGNLDVRLSYSKDMNTWDEVTADTDGIFKVKGADENAEHDMLWEPGAANVVYFKIENKGNLAAKYDFAVVIDREVKGTNFKGEEFKLSEYIKGGVVDVTAAYENTDEGRAAAVAALGENPATLSTISGTTLVTGEMNGAPAENTEKIFALVLTMPNDAETGEKTNYKTPEGEGAQRPGVKLKIKLVATQDVGESDSFGSEYDKGAYEIKVPAGATPEETQENVKNAIISAESGDTIILPQNSKVDLTAIPLASKELNLKGDKTTVVSIKPEGSGQIFGSGSKVNFEGVTVQGVVSGSYEYKGLDSNTATYTNCTFEGCTTLYGDSVTFNNCTFNQSYYEYSVYTYGAKVATFNNCTFNSIGKALKAYCGGNTTVVNVNNCTFNIEGTISSSANKPAIAIDTDTGNCGITVNVNGCTQTGYKNSGDGDMTYINNEALVGFDTNDSDRIKINLNGTKVHPAN